VEHELDMASIQHYCINIRNAILFIKDKSAQFRDFPKGCCRDITLISSLYLEENGCSGITYCSREFTSLLSSHAWLEYKGFIVDLTADQFNNEFPGILIIPVNEAGLHHQKDREEICSLAIAGMDAGKLLFDYSLIKKQIEFDSDLNKHKE
jgi:hypothetical protein